MKLLSKLNAHDETAIFKMLSNSMPSCLSKARELLRDIAFEPGQEWMNEIHDMIREMAKNETHSSWAKDQK